jgi:hypothetical protein
MSTPEIADSGAELLHDAVDIHIHTAPDIFARNVTAESAARQAKAAGMAAIVVKSHSTDTSARAQLASEAVDFPVFGGVALNHPVGGINHHAVIESARQGGRLVWMPTIGARHFRRLAGGAPMLASVIPADEPGLTVLDGGNLTAAALRVLDAVAEADLTLASGHLAPAETIALFEAARARGIERLIVTHPHVPFVAMSVPEMKALADLGAYLELTDHQPIAERVEVIRAIGVEHCLLSTDGGTVEEPTPVERLRSSVLGLAAAGFSEAEIRYLASSVPLYLVGLGPRPEAGALRSARSEGGAPSDQR